MPWFRRERRIPVGRRSGLERDWSWSWEPPRPERARWQRWPHVVRAIADIAVVVGLTLATSLIVLLAPFVEPARIGLGLAFVLFLPGYVLMAALYPRKHDLDLVERLALSLGLSIVVVPLIGLGIDYSPWSIRLNPILVFVTVFIVHAAGVATYRRLTLPSDEAVGIPVNLALPKWSRVRMANRFLGLVLILALAGLGVGAYFLATSSTDTEEFTQFYVLLTLGVVNHEREESRYRVQAAIGGRPAVSLDSLQLANNEKWEGPLVLTATQPGRNLKVEFVLYKGDNSVPYRTLHLWMDVEGDPSEP
jgi:uncharacterized membrane protein